ncbi:retrovirus-related pol polyprotein from transposon TNT 1-94 [Tanacetum coccineum]
MVGENVIGFSQGCKGLESEEKIREDKITKLVTPESEKGAEDQHRKFMDDLNAEYHERALLANQKRFYKGSGRGKYKGLKVEMVVPTKRIADMTKGKSEKGKKEKEKSEKGLVSLCHLSGDDDSCSSDDGKERLTHPLSTSSFHTLDGRGVSSLQAPLYQAPQPSSSNATSKRLGLDTYYLKRSVWYLDSGRSRHMTRIKQYLQRYSKESGPKVVFGDDSSGDIEGYGSVNYNEITFTRVAYMNGLKHNLISISQLCDANYKVLFTKTRGTIYNQNDEVVLIAPRRRDVYVIDMSSFNKESNACFFAKASLSINWLWYKRLSHLNFKNINNLAKHNLVFGLPSLTFFKDKNCSACEKGKHHRASFETKRSFSINKSLHLLHMDLFGPIENLNEVRVKELRSDNGTEFINHKLEELCDEKGVKNPKKDRTLHVFYVSSS